MTVTSVEMIAFLYTGRFDNYVPFRIVGVVHILLDPEAGRLHLQTSVYLLVDEMAASSEENSELAAISHILKYKVYTIPSIASQVIVLSDRVSVPMFSAFHASIF